MPVTFDILPARALAYVRFEGEITVPEATGAFAAYGKHPDMRADQRHLLDMSRVTGWASDFAGLMQLHARQLDVLLEARHEILYVYFAPNAPASDLARLAVRSWDEVPGVIATLQETEADALNVLGQPETTISALLQKA